MTIGIYKLFFNGLDKVYIGQSINIERRYRAHLNNCLNKQASIKLQEAYNKYGLPSIEILCITKKEELDTKENYYIELYNSVNTGLNTMEKAHNYPDNFGELNPNSIYTDNQIIEVFKILIEFPLLTMTEVSTIINVHISTVKNIHNGYSHKWLKDLYPEEYTKLENRRILSKSLVNTSFRKGILRPSIYSPEGIEYTGITNVSAFAREHGLNPGAINSVFNGKAKHHKGWHI